MSQHDKITGGLLLAAILAAVSVFISRMIPYDLIGAGVFALLIGMLLNPVVSKYRIFDKGFSFTSKKILRLAIVLMGFSLSFSQVLQVGRFSLFVMMFTLLTAFGGGYLLGKLFKMNWFFLHWTGLLGSLPIYPTRVNKWLNTMDITQTNPGE